MMEVFKVKTNIDIRLRIRLHHTALSMVQAYLEAKIIFAYLKTTLCFRLKEKPKDKPFHLCWKK